MRPFLNSSSAENNFGTNDVEKSEEELFELTVTALAMNNAEMVKLMLENGVSLRDFLSVKRLLQLYNEVQCLP